MDFLPKSVYDRGMDDEKAPKFERDELLGLQMVPGMLAVLAFALIVAFLF